MPRACLSFGGPRISIESHLDASNIILWDSSRVLFSRSTVNRIIRMHTGPATTVSSYMSPITLINMSHRLISR